MAKRLGVAIAVLVTWACATAAAAASFDCAKAASAMERTICADPALSALDEQLAARFSAALAASLDPGDLRAEQRRWLARMRAIPGTAELTNDYQVRLDVLARIIADTPPVSALRGVSEAKARAACLPALASQEPDETCAVDGFGPIGRADGQDLVYALYSYRTASGVAMGMRALIFERAPGGTLNVLYAPEYDGGDFQAPKLIHTAAGLLLHVPGTDTGTANLNVERLFVRRDGRWRDVDVTSWQEALASRLPRGTQARIGVYPDYAAMTAQTPLWRGDRDCGSGGHAVIGLAWAGDRIAIARLEVRRGAAGC